ncbi:hypothetical protein UFOVP116_224 [uncultured Caudovirales phage]|uniref:Uncharacterized protein n=1 Tax=uncultured Caudovirales phage TaxID=2100421 RepID=A0A6J5LEE1_9CAUD|nr:hypothetical protein UFOVP116_224 [uncultured Caudovirales phage]
MANTIKEAVLPLKQVAEDRARAAITALIDATLADLAAVGNDVNVFAPYPQSGIGRKEYTIRLERRRFVESITSSFKSSLRFGEPYIRVPSTEGRERAIKNTIEAATASYDAYVAKLESKIGAVTEATLLTTSDVWYDSRLCVVKSDGSTETWTTKCILNTSSLGKVFNQWPTRIVK